MQSKAYLFLSLSLATACGTLDGQTDSAAPLSSSVYAHCDKILEGDLFNRVHISQDLKTREVFSRRFLQYTEDVAYDMYKQNFARTRAASGGANINLLGIISIGGDFGSKEMLSKDEYKEQFREFKRLNQSSVDYSKDVDYVSDYSSVIRDEASINAWVKCVTADPQKQGLVAFGWRDAQGAVYLRVIWSPGDFVTISPSVSIQFSPTAGGQVEASPVEVLPHGSSGRIFVVRNPVAGSFDIGINGTAAGATFSTSASIPAKAPAVDPMVLPESIQFVGEAYYSVPPSVAIAPVPIKNNTVGNMTLGDTKSLIGFKMRSANRIPGVEFVFSGWAGRDFTANENQLVGSATHPTYHLLEGAAVRLVGPNANKYDVSITCHLEGIGLHHVEGNDAYCGRKGTGKALQGFKVTVIKKH